MADKAPTSYKDPYWAGLAANTESKLGLPGGLLTSVVMNGEKSNSDQVSSAGARTPFQITPETRKLALDKYGVDAYLSPENAAEVAGNLLKDSLQRNKGNPMAAVAEYHGGTDRANWGPITKSYVQRVMSGMNAPSTFQRAVADQKASEPQSNAIANVYKAYQSGQMAPEDAKQFEDDVKSGLVMLPKGAALQGQAPQTQAGTTTPEPKMLPVEVADAFLSGKMSEQERADLAHDVQSGLVKLPGGTSPMPTEQPNGSFAQPTETPIAPYTPPTLGQRLTGVGETALALGTGMTSGAAGQVAGTIEGVGQALLNGTFNDQMANDLIEKQAAETAAGLTYQPRTPLGQEYTETAGRALAQTVPAMGLPGEMAQLGHGVRAAAPAIRAAAQPIVTGAETAQQALGSAAKSTVDAARNMPQKAMEMVGMREPVPPTVTAGAPQSGGAAAVPSDVIRSEKAASLPVPITLTKGAETREPGQLAFEKEQMKGPLGAPLRQRAEENNIQAMQNFDALIDKTGATTPDIAATGNKVVDALSKGYKAAKNEVNVAYQEARKSGELEAPVDLSAVVNHLNESAPEGATAPLINTARALAIKLGIAKEENGQLIPVETKPRDPLTNTPAEIGVNIRKAELFRQAINRNTDFEPTNIRQSAIIKGLVDDATEGTGGELYAKARALRAQQARKYENRAIVANLITNRKGMDDPKVAVDQVFNKSILNGSPDEITFLKRVLNTSGEDGQQAWKELQGATLQHIQDEATKGVGMDSAGNPLISPAKLHQTVTALDKNGRLDIVLGKQQAATVRDLNEVVRYVNTVPPGTLINNSGTVGTLLAAMGEAGATGALTGLPIPAITILKTLGRQIQNNKLKLKINAALNAKPKF